MKGLPSYPNELLRGWRLGEGVPGPDMWYRICRRAMQMILVAGCRVRAFNRHYEPTSGSALYMCNHQSFMDPPLMSLALRRPMNYMARASLFRYGPVKRLFESLNAFPVKRGEADMGALKEALRRLKRREQIVLFPEGTRTYDGRIMPFLPGAAMLARRGADWTVPTIIDGAYECWPRKNILPRTGQIAIIYGPPMPREEAERMSNEEFITAMREQMIALQADIRRRLGRRPFDYSADG